MLHRVSLLEELKKGGFEASLVTTYNAYLPFYEEVVLRRMNHAGIGHNVLLMDAQQYAISLRDNPPRLAGRQYSLVPINVPGAFHPKLIFLAGKTKGLILIGSHNVTIAGFGFNREMTGLVRIDGEKDAPGIALANDTLAAVDQWLEQFTPDIPSHARDMVKRFRDFAPWLKGASQPNLDLQLLAGHPGGTTLWDQFVQSLDGDADRVSVSGAFFDQRLDFISSAQSALQPKTFTVAVDPETVQLNENAKVLDNISFVDAASFGNEDEKEGRGYLHAKSIAVECSNGNDFFAVGSANPSRPAWLADNLSGNVELMLLRRGAEAKKALQAIGLDLVHDLPILNEANWQTISNNSDREEGVDQTGPLTGLALADRHQVTIDLDMCRDPAGYEFVLCDEVGAEIARTTVGRIENSSLVIEFSEEAVSNATFLHAYKSDDLFLKLLLHHAKIVEDQSRTGNQKRFKHALQSLDTDAPNIDLLVQCLDKIVFGEDQPQHTSTGKKPGEGDRSNPESDDPGTLAIDIDQMEKRGNKNRLKHASDFGYLLDALIYHLGIREKPQTNTDSYDRSEEEQVGADDDPDSDVILLTPEKQAELLQICHSKVRTIVNRMSTQLNACAEGKQPFSAVVIRLLAVLAVLRELRRCDGRTSWVEKGTTTVPPEQRSKLLETIMLTLFEPTAEKISLLDLNSADEELRESDDIARLKGLVLWLAWDSGLTLDLQKPFMESDEGEQARFRRNAMVLALAQMIRRDEVVVDEARQSIGGLTSSELDWLEEIEELETRCESLRTGSAPTKPAQLAQPGDVAAHNSLENWDLRVVSGGGDKQVSLIKLTKGGKPMAFRPDHLSVAPFVE